MLFTVGARWFYHLFSLWCLLEGPAAILGCLSSAGRPAPGPAQHGDTPLGIAAGREMSLGVSPAATVLHGLLVQIFR